MKNVKQFELMKKTIEIAKKYVKEKNGPKRYFKNHWSNYKRYSKIK